MPIKPDIVNMKATSADIVNAVRSDASPEYQRAVPIAQANTASIRAIGDIINNYQPFQNEFLKALLNRIGRVLVTSKLYLNPWASFKKGMLEFGESVEEIFVNISKPFNYDPELAQTNVFKREIPDVRAAFHVMNYQKMYKDTVSNDQLRQAFLSWNGITDLIAKIVDSMYTGANYDEFITMKYLVCRMLVDGNMYGVNIPAVTPADSKQIVSTIKGVSNQLRFLSTKYNMSGVSTYTDYKDQFVIMNASFDAVIDVEVLASAFNMDKAEFMGNRVMVDSFSDIDTARLALLFAGDPAYKPFTTGEIALLETIPAVVIDRDWFMIFDNFYNFTEIYNPEGLYWNYFYHTWKTFSASPYANGVAFTTATPGVTSVTVTPGTATIAKASSAQFTAAVVTTGVAPKSVAWSIAATSGTDPVTSIISDTGLVSISGTEVNTSLTVTATSTFDATKKGTAVITVSN